MIQGNEFIVHAALLAPPPAGREDLFHPQIFPVASYDYVQRSLRYPFPESVTDRHSLLAGHGYEESEVSWPVLPVLVRQAEGCSLFKNVMTCVSGKITWRRGKPCVSR